MTLLRVSDLKTYFYTRDGITRAVDGISFEVNEGETLGIVGESGSGKSVSCYSLLGLLQCPPGRIENGVAFFKGIDLLKCLSKELRKIRGNRISMIFQDPMTSLNPFLTIGLQLTESLLTHKNMLCACITEKVHHHQVREDNFILIPPLYHTGAKMHWFGSLIVGGRAVILKGVSPEWILDAVSEEGGTIVWLLVPWVQDILLKLDSGKLKLENYNLDQWRLMHMGAMPIPPSLIKRWKAYFPHMEYNTTYGLSEASGPNCMQLGIGNLHKVGSIGRPGFNWEARIVGEDGQDVPGGQTGELIVRGNGVMKEYYRNPEATAEALKDGWLHTGDMARRDKDGFIYLVDRKKDFIITGGENVFPVEVEHFVYRHSSVKDAAAIGYPDERLGEVTAIVIELAPGKTLTRKEVLKYCDQLPRYKRPRKVFFGEIPRNPTGKIEKPKLREKYIGRKEAINLKTE